MVLALSGCVGAVNSKSQDKGQDPLGSDKPPGGEDSEARDPAPANATAAAMPLRRLSRREFDNTVRDLLGVTSKPARAFPREPSGETGFAVPSALSELEAQLLMEAAQTVAADAVRDLPKLMGCDASASEDACLKRFLDSFVPRAFRRPAMEQEIAGLTALFEIARKTEGLDQATSVQIVLEAILQSPSFLYHWETGPSLPKPEGQIVALSGYQMASRLSYVLWGTMPDPELMSAAASGGLNNVSGILAQAKRMIADEARLGDTLSDFHEQWLHTKYLVDQQKNTNSYASWTPTLAAAAAKEMGDYVRHVHADDDRLETLLTGSWVVKDPALSSLYGLQNASSQALDGKQRSGILTLAGFLAANSGADGSHPVTRGQTLYRQMLCGDLPPPPPDIPAAPEPAENLSTRDRFAQHAMDPCAGCHKLFDPLGFAFEHYDGIGQYRTRDGGQTVDASGTVELPDGKTITFQNAIELAQHLSTSDVVRSCYVKQWMRYALSRPDAPADEKSRSDISNRFAKSDYEMTSVLLSLVESTAFRYRSVSEGEVKP